jgi:FtsP/CotA-like multicopper oxidase with cupredoxin domain
MAARVEDPESGTTRPDPLAMSDFNVLTINGKAFPATAPLVVARGERVRVRIGNLGPMDHHPDAFPRLTRCGWSRPTAARSRSRPRWPETTVLVPVGAVRVVEFIADVARGLGRCTAT